MIIRTMTSFFLFPATLFICSLAQSPEDQTFGWSLKVDPGTTRKDKRVKPALPRPVKSGEEGEILIESSLVLSDVLVQDGKGVPVSGLQAADFEITEDGRRQKIDVFAQGSSSSIPRSIFLVIDYSLSQWRYIEKTIAAAKTLVERLRPTDRMAIISDDVSLVIDLTGDKERLKDSLEALRKKCLGGNFGQSRQYSALFAVLNEKIERNGTRNIVIFQTDGDELSALGAISPIKYNQLSTAAKRKGATIYSVYTGTRFIDLDNKRKITTMRAIVEDEAQAFYRLQHKQTSFRRIASSNEYLLSRAERMQIEERAVADIATRSGGIFQFLENAHQAADIYDRILADIGHRYLIGYYLSHDTDPERPKDREVTISLRTKGKYRIVGGRTFATY